MVSSSRSVYLAEEYIRSDGNRYQDDIEFSDRGQLSLATALLLKLSIKLSPFDVRVKG